MIHPNHRKVSVAKATGTLRHVMYGCLIAMAACMISSCKGRTMHNMVPLGDTVEITPDTLVDTGNNFYYLETNDTRSI